MSTTSSARTVAQLLLALAAASVVVACGASGGSPGNPAGPPEGPNPAAGLTVVAGGNASDTIGATLAQPLVVEVRDGLGAASPGVIIRFECIPVQDSMGVLQPGAFVAAFGTKQFATAVESASDAQGRAAATVQFGTLAGVARIAVSVPGRAIADTVRLVVAPGSPTKFAFLPSDTGVSVGGSVQLRAAGIDRAGNPRIEGLTYDPSPRADIATVSAAGRVTGVAVGAVTLTAHSGAHTVSGQVEVVPKGVIAAYYLATAPGDSSGIVTMNLDGSGLRWVARAEASVDGPPNPVWTSGGDIVFTAGPAHGSLFVAAPSGGAALLNPSGVPNTAVESWPRYDAATSRIFYCGFTTIGPWQLFAHNADGTVDLISPEGPTHTALAPSPSPDGSKLAYVGYLSNSPVVRVYDLAARATSAWSVSGQAPSWSPLGDRIVYVPEGGGRMGVVNADGSNPHPLTDAFIADAPASWSPDGAWIVAKSLGHPIDLINARTGQTFALSYLRSYYYPAWK